MSLSRSPSPRRAGGWASPGLSADISHGKVRAASPNITSINGSADGSSGGPTWASAKQRSARVEHGGYPKYESQNNGMWRRFRRTISMSLPIDEQEKLGGRGSSGSLRSLWTSDWRDLPRRLLNVLSRRRKWLAVLITIIALLTLWNTSLVYWYRRTAWLGGGAKFVIILGANQGGGVMEWKGAREWAIERDSVRNKKKYAATWGYELDIVDMSTKKRYAHEWRESWEKVDVIRKTMKKYPDAEWFWWLDLNTFIMEPTYSLQSHIFDHLDRTVYRDINVYNPLKIQHPPNATSDPSFANYLDPVSLSAVGDGRPESINLVLPQDCGGFNLGSFFMRRSEWADRIMDIWWDPVFYEQRHMEWEHKEQDALEYLYTNQPWVRPSVAFLPQRKINAFPNGACGDDRGMPKGGVCPKSLSQSIFGGEEDPKTECGLQGVHYQESERDFLVNMAGCEWGRDCWSEMYRYRELSNRLNRTLWAKFKDGLWELWHRKEIQAKAREKAEREEKERKQREQEQLERERKEREALDWRPVQG